MKFTNILKMQVDLFNKIIKNSFFIREFEGLLLKLFNKGLLNGTVHTCVGQELIPVILSQFLNINDRIFSNHRGHGHYLAFNGDHISLLAELMGKLNGVSGGIGGSQHIYNNNFISNGIQGGLTPLAVGYSYVNKLKKINGISVTFIGDGTLGQGVLYEALNLSAVLDAPTLFILENNQYAQSTSFKETFSGSVEKRVEGFGIKYFTANIWDIDCLNDQIKNAVEFVRNGKPAFIEISCYRLNSHSKGDDNRFDNEINEFAEKDLLNRFIIENKEQYCQFKNEIDNKLEIALKQCEVMVNLSEMEKFEYITDSSCEILALKDSDENQDKRQNHLIYCGLKDILEKGDSLFIGEDIKFITPFTGKPYGGAFKVSNDLSELFPNRVINSPISEQAIIGFGIGAALNGYNSIVEIMFGDFITLGIDQIIQQASKIPIMFGQSIKLPLIIRTPMGARRGYGPTHSQNIEKLFLFLPNINVIALNSFVNPQIVYGNIQKHLTTTAIVIEDKISYTKFFNIKKIVGYDFYKSQEIFPFIQLKPNFTKFDFTIILYGGMIDEIVTIIPELIENEIFPNIICPTSLVPLNIYPIKQALKENNKILFIEEGTKYGGFSSEVTSYLLENNIKFDLIGKISNESLIPCSKDAELNSVPNSKIILKEIIKLFK
jgi:2-oxoisovalerate dehydrogenase E1 component